MSEFLPPLPPAPPNASVLALRCRIVYSTRFASSGLCPQGEGAPRKAQQVILSTQRTTSNFLDNVKYMTLASKAVDSAGQKTVNFLGCKFLSPTADYFRVFPPLDSSNEI
ncbi:hypothetical protein GYMLUDRAFT_396529 [Collybiopsis luxurians FD-317 M1]|uniref:Uncharacterized protein n=1 Tax=Collybiopsis luxurians FD-317 M1 TaxID=944289 RepID=A0A0D0AM45_9AGAR|nr:hypothetical protein GYMLUDRAFT_396529 [Collybiopsis luxurians FD-317 M1]